VKFFYIISILVLVGLLIFFSREKFGDIRPAVIPANNLESQESTSSGDIVTSEEEVGFPLKTPEGYKISVFAKGVVSARDIEFAGDSLIVSQPAAGKISLLADLDNNGTAEVIKDLITGLNRPHGIAFDNGKLFVAEETKISRYNLDLQNQTATLDKKLFDLPKGGRHFTRTIEFDRNGKMFVSLGSSCDVCIEKESFLASVIVSDAEGSQPRVYSKGLRNAVFLERRPDTDEIWATEMGRDFLGDDIPPDEINILKENVDFGWPNCYGDRIPDKRFNVRLNDASCAGSELPAFNLQAHSAPLGLQFVEGGQFPANSQGDLLVSYHGSWNRSTSTGYKVVKLNVENNKVTSQEDFITGFLDGSAAFGRPVDLEFDGKGSLYISDDKAGSIYKVIFQK